MMGEIVALMIAADGYSPEKIQGRSHRSPRVTANCCLEIYLIFLEKGEEI